MRASIGAGRRLSARAGVVALITAVGAGTALGGCGGSSDTSGGSGSEDSSSAGIDTQLALVGYSTPKQAYAALTSAFEQTAAGKGVGFSQSFGASGSQSRAVDSGQPADVVAFSTTPDMARLVKDGVVSSNWDANPAKGMSSDSVVVFVVRKGNPKHITGWDDLVKPGVDVITPNPSTSGSARWNILAGYGAELKEGRAPEQALAYVKTLLTKNVSVQDPSASAALQTFTSGKGDVLLDYESDAIAAQRAGDSIQYMIPKQTLLIETPIAVTSTSKHSAEAQAFAGKFPAPPQLFTIDYLGGWTKAKTEFFDSSSGSITKIEQQAGVPTASS
jgi:sulfate transport system substrate-binding protein